MVSFLTSDLAGKSDYVALPPAAPTLVSPIESVSTEAIMERGRSAADLREETNRNLEAALAAAKAEIEWLDYVAREAPKVWRDNGVWCSAEAARMSGVTLEVVRGGCEPRHDDPACVVAHPFFRLGCVRVVLERGFEVGTTVPGRVEAIRGWDREMLAHGLPAAVVDACARALDDLARTEAARRFDAREAAHWRGACSEDASWPIR